MRIASLLSVLALLSACGVGGEPQHPQAQRSFESQLKLGSSYNI